MEIIKCDKCNKTKGSAKSEKWIAGHIMGKDIHFLNFDLCPKCGEPLVKYLKKYLKIKIASNKK